MPHTVSTLMLLPMFASAAVVDPGFLMWGGGKVGY